MSGDLRTWLDDLDAAREKATPGPWRTDAEYPHDIAAPDGGSDVGYAHDPADAALIVAAVNNLPRLTAAVRAVLDLSAERQSTPTPDRTEFHRRLIGVLSHSVFRYGTFQQQADFLMGSILRPLWAERDELARQVAAVRAWCDEWENVLPEIVRVVRRALGDPR